MNQLRSEPLKLYAGYILATKSTPTGITHSCIPVSLFATASTTRHSLERELVQNALKKDFEGWSVSSTLVEIPQEHIRTVYESQIDAVEQGQ